MTKLRAPLSFEDGIDRIVGLLGRSAAAAAINAAERTLAAYSDPDDPRQIKIGDALRLDAAYQRAGGEGAPLYEAYALQLEVSAAATAAGTVELTRRASIAARESGQAVAALLATTLPGATAADRALAVREVREGMDALRNTLPLIDGEQPIDSS